MQPNYRSLAFLLSIGSLPLACTKDKNDTDGDDSTTTASTNPNATTGTGTDSTDPTQASDPTSTGGQTGGQTTTGQTTTTMSPSDPTAASEPPPTTFLTSESESADTGSETEEDTGLPPATDPTCIAYGNHLVECFPRYTGYQEYFAQNCEYVKMYGMADGDACVQALDAYFVCISMADCAELDPEMPGCQKEMAAVQAACPSLADTDTDTDAGSDTGDSSG